MEWMRRRRNTCIGVKSYDVPFPSCFLFESYVTSSSILHSGRLYHLNYVVLHPPDMV